MKGPYAEAARWRDRREAQHPGPVMAIVEPDEAESGFAGIQDQGKVCPVVQRPDPRHPENGRSDLQ